MTLRYSLHQCAYWAASAGIITFATTFLLQMTSYAFLSPVQVYYANEKVCPEDMVKGQAFITASYTLGCAMGPLVGGQLLERCGVSAILIAGVATAAAGTLIPLLTIERKDPFRVNSVV